MMSGERSGEVAVTMRLYHCTVCDLWFEAELDALRARPARCPGCGEHEGVVPFDERRVVLCEDDADGDGPVHCAFVPAWDPSRPWPEQLREAVLQAGGTEETAATIERVLVERQEQRRKRGR